MNDVLLFVYPDKGYLESEEAEIAFAWSGRKVVPYVLGFYDHLINVRYRAHGYKVVWLMHGLAGNPTVPDTSLLSPWLTVGPTDVVISAGITKSDLNRDLRADGQFVSSQLPGDIDRMVLAGFHERDCVDKLARYFYNTTACDVMVDIDLCHMMARKLACRVAIPDHRLDFSPQGCLPMISAADSRKTVKQWERFPWRRQRRMYELTAEERAMAKVMPKAQVNLAHQPEFGHWEAGGKYAAFLMSDDGSTPCGKIFALNGRILALDWNGIPADATPDEAEDYTAIAEFENELDAADWLAERTAKSPREPIKPR